MSHLRTLDKKGLIQPPPWLVSNVHYETIMGSVAYGVSSDTSDMDVYGFCIPPKEILFPHLAGDIPGFGIRSRVTPFEQFQQHHIEDKEALGGKGRMYDVTIYSIVKYFQLCMENNPNMIDSLFTPQSAVLHATQVAQHVRENRRLFLHKGAWHKFKGYAYSQMHKIQIKNPEKGSKRYDLVQEFGYDVKFAYHVVRLMDEIEQILTEGDIDLQRNREQLKAIRRGEWKEEEIHEHFSRKERELESLYTTSSLPMYPDEDAIKKLLIECLEMHYGDLSSAVRVPSNADTILDKVIQVLREYRSS